MVPLGYVSLTSSLVTYVVSYVIFGGPALVVPDRARAEATGGASAAAAKICFKNCDCLCEQDRPVLSINSSAFTGLELQPSN